MVNSIKSADLNVLVVEPAKVCKSLLEYVLIRFALRSLILSLNFLLTF